MIMQLRKAKAFLLVASFGSIRSTKRAFSPARSLSISPTQQSVYVALGSNLGDRSKAIHSALAKLRDLGDIRATSYLYETPPMYHTNQDPFLNAVCQLYTTIPAVELLHEFQRIECEVGRVETFRNGPRVIDLDMLSYGSSSISHADLQIPHPRIAERAFVLRPLRDITTPECTLPINDRFVESLNIWNAYSMLPEQDKCGLRKVMPCYNHLTGSTRLLDFEALRGPMIMGILNVTPDSFSDGGVHAASVESAVAHAQRMVAEGATILDIGGESTRPGAVAVAEQEELRRVVPVISALRSAGCTALISVDTRNAAVAQAAIQAGADVVNDVSAGAHDPAMLHTVGRLGVPYIAMHMRGDPTTMTQPAMLDYSAPLPGLNTGVPHLAKAAGHEDFSSTSSAESEEDVVGVVATELAARLKDIDRHIPRWLQLIDPGIGFAKRAEQSAELMRPESLRRLRQALGGREMAMGCSRKRVLTHLWRNSGSNGGAAVGELGTGTTCNGSDRNLVAHDRDPTLEERDMLTAAAGCAAFLGGAKILRVHNVHYTKSVCDVFAALVDEHK